MMHDGADEEDVVREARGRDLEDDIMQIVVEDKLHMPILVLLCIAVLASSLGALGVFIDNRRGTGIAEDTQSLVEDIAVVVSDIEARNSPAALEARQEAVNDIILEVACNDRETLEDFSAQLFGELIRAGVLPEGTTVNLEPATECVDR